MMLGPFRFLLPARMTTNQWGTVFAYIDHFIDRAIREQDSKKQDNTKKSVSVLQIVSSQTDDRVEIRNQVLQGQTARADCSSYILI